MPDLRLLICLTYRALVLNQLWTYSVMEKWPLLYKKSPLKITVIYGQNKIYFMAAQPYGRNYNVT